MGLFAGCFERLSSFLQPLLRTARFLPIIFFLRCQA